jgi:integrase
VYVILAAHYRLHELTRERKAFRQSITIVWHSFRHSLATNRALSVDIKVAQELMRHSSCRTTLDVYTRAVDQQSGKRA